MLEVSIACEMQSCPALLAEIMQNYLFIKPKASLRWPCQNTHTYSHIRGTYYLHEAFAGWEEIRLKQHLLSVVKSQKVQWWQLVRSPGTVCLSAIISPGTWCSAATLQTTNGYFCQSPFPHFMFICQLILKFCVKHPNHRRVSANLGSYRMTSSPAAQRITVWNFHTFDTQCADQSDINQKHWIKYWKHCR